MADQVQPGNAWRPSSEAVGVEEFEYAIEGALVVMHFWAPWNPYDRPLDANLQVLKPGIDKRFRFYSVNTDETAFEGIVEAHHVGALPTLLCFANGRVRGRFHGLQTLEELRGFLEEMGKGSGR